MKRTTAVTLAILFCLAAVGSYAQKPEIKPAGAPFEARNIEFPKVEGWNLGPKAALPMGQPGIVVNYDSPDRERMTIYVYRRDDSQSVPNEYTGIVKNEFDGAKGALQTVADAGIYTNLKILKSDSAPFAGTDGKVKALRALISFEAGGNKLNSELYLFPYNGYVVKLRVSRPAALPATTEQYSRLLKAIDTLFSQ